MAIFSILALIVSLIGYYGFNELILDIKKSVLHQEMKSMIAHMEDSTISFGFLEISQRTVRIISMVLTIIAIMFLVAKQLVMIKWTYHYVNRKDDDDLLKGYDHQIKADNFVTADLKPRYTKEVWIGTYFNFGFLLEIIILCIFPWPFWDKVITKKYFVGGKVVNSDTLISDYFLAIMLLRVFFAIRSFTNNS